MDVHEVCCFLSALSCEAGALKISIVIIIIIKSLLGASISPGAASNFLGVDGIASPVQIRCQGNC